MAALCLTDVGNDRLFALLTQYKTIPEAVNVGVVADGVDGFEFTKAGYLKVFEAFLDFSTTGVQGHSARATAPIAALHEAISTGTSFQAFLQSHRAVFVRYCLVEVAPDVRPRTPTGEVTAPSGASICAVPSSELVFVPGGKIAVAYVNEPDAWGRMRPPTEAQWFEGTVACVGPGPTLVVDFPPTGGKPAERCLVNYLEDEVVTGPTALSFTRRHPGSILMAAGVVVNKIAPASMSACSWVLYSNQRADVAVFAADYDSEAAYLGITPLLRRPKAGGVSVREWVDAI